MAAASFNGYFVKWNFFDFAKGANTFFVEDMINGTSYRPYVHRRLIVEVVKEIKENMSEQRQQNFIDKYTRKFFLPQYYAGLQIENSYFIEYYLVYFFAFTFLFLSMFVIRQIGIEITGSATAGTLTACCFTIILPLFDVRFYYDFGEIFFFALAALLAIKGYWLALILIAPIAEYNKESFLFFWATLFPLLSVKLGWKKSAAVTMTAIILSGLAYLYVRSIFAQNPGEAVEFHLDLHAQNLLHGWTKLNFNYGQWFGYGMFLPYILLIAWIAKNSWQKLSEAWKNHVKIAAAINFPLYIICCWDNEVRNLSLLFISSIAMLAIFIKGAIMDEGKD